MSNIKKTNSRNFFLGLGGSDAKSNVATLFDLENLITDFSDFYQEDDIVWVVAEKSFYVTKPAENPPYEIYSSGSGGGGGGESANVTIYYGNEIEILGYLQGDQSKAPSLLGYKDGDGFISSSTISSGSSTIEKFDVYEASIPGDPSPESYIFVGSIQGQDGLDGTAGNPGNTGATGAKGDKGDSFTVDQQGLLADRETDCDTRPNGYSYLATDDGLLYFKEGHTGPSTCTWSAGIPFGKGEPGETTYTVFRRELKGSPPPAPSVGTLHPAGGEGWFDAPPSNGGDPLQRLWTSKTMYSDNTPLANITWSQPIIIDGEAGDEGNDGSDGKPSGFWVVWSDSQSPSLSISVKPIIDGNGDYSLDLSGDPDWYDTIGVNDTPLWMGQIVLNSNTNSWASWQFSKIAGERPPYMIDLYKRAASLPAIPTTTLEYINSGTGTYTTGAEAAALVGDGWTDAPTGSGDRLYMTKIYLSHDGANNVWSAPSLIDGIEGVSAGVWIVWSENEINDKPASPAPVETIQSGDGTSLPGLTLPWIDDADGLDPKWSATSYFNTGTGVWTNWTIAQIKGGDGLNASDERTFVSVEVGTTGGGINIYDTIEDALADASNIEGINGFGIVDYHNGGTAGNFPPPAVGNNLFEDSAGTIPYQFGTEKFIIFVDYVSIQPPPNTTILNYAKVSQSGTILAIYTPEEALATVPPPIGGLVEFEILDWQYEYSQTVVNVPRSIKFGQAYLKCVTEHTTTESGFPSGSQLWIVGAEVNLPGPHQDRDLDMRGSQVSWSETSPGEYIVDVTTSAIRLYSGKSIASSSGNTAIASYWKLVVRLFY